MADVFVGLISGILTLLVLLSPLIIGTLYMGAQQAIKVKHKDSGIGGSCFVGYCWTYFFFGFFVPIFRGEILIGVLHMIFTMVTFGLFHLIMPFLYNRQYTIRLLTNAWVLNDTDELNSLARSKIGMAET